jgi:carbonic anhydrase
MFSNVKTATKVVAGFGAMLAVFIGLIVAGTMPAAAADHVSGVKPDEAIQRLKDGNDRFVAGKSSHPDATVERREDTAKNGQHPFAVVVSCSDSRVPVEIVFDQGIGDLFVVRVAGNVCNRDEIGSVEYGTDHLATPVLVVLGHTHCGAVTAVAQGAELPGNVAALVRNIHPAVETAKKTHPGVEGDALVAAAIDANVWQSIADLLKNSPIARERVEAGKLKIVGAVYDIEAGQVKWLGENPDQQKLLKDAGNGSGHSVGE